MPTNRVSCWVPSSLCPRYPPACLACPAWGGEFSPLVNWLPELLIRLVIVHKANECDCPGNLWKTKLIACPRAGRTKELPGCLQASEHVIGSQSLCVLSGCLRVSLCLPRLWSIWPVAPPSPLTALFSVSQPHTALPSTLYGILWDLILFSKLDVACVWVASIGCGFCGALLILSNRCKKPCVMFLISRADFLSLTVCVLCHSSLVCGLEGFIMRSRCV